MRWRHLFLFVVATPTLAGLSGCVGSPAGLLHEVRRGDTLSGLAELYGVAPPSLVRPANAAAALQIGELIYVPAPWPRWETAEPAAARRREPAANTDVSSKKPAAKSPPAKTAAPAVASPPPSLLWPVRGKLVRTFGPQGASRSQGIEVAAAEGTAFVAAAPGEVVYAGDQIAAFGRMAILRHAAGWFSVYAHAASLDVKPGRHVSAGQVLGTVGVPRSGGRARLYFELRQGREPVDPRPWLERSSAR